MKPDRQHDDEPRDTGPLGAAVDRDPDRKRSLSLRAPPLALPSDEGPALESAVPPPATSNLDAWSQDKLRRSSLPPRLVHQAVSGFPPAIATPLPPQDLLDAGHEHDALALVGRVPSAGVAAFDLVQEMADRFALGDFSGALRVAHLLLGQNPEDELAAHYAQVACQKLEGLYCSRLLASGRVPEKSASESELRWLGLDPQVGALLSRIDGSTDVDEVIRLSGMPRLDALRALIQLVEAQVVRLV